MRAIIRLENIFEHPTFIKGDIAEYIDGSIDSIVLEPNDVLEIVANIPDNLKIKSTPYFSNKKIKYISLDLVDKDF